MLVLKVQEGERVALFDGDRFIGWVWSLGFWKMGFDMPRDIGIVREETLRPEQRAKIPVKD